MTALIVASDTLPQSTVAQTISAIEMGDFGARNAPKGAWTTLDRDAVRFLVVAFPAANFYAWCTPFCFAVCVAIASMSAGERQS